MAFRHGKGTSFWFDATDLTTYFSEADIAEKADAAETTTFGSTAKTYVIGMQDGAISLKGFFDGASGASDAVLTTALGSATDNICTLTLESGVGIGAAAKLWAAQTVEYSINTPVKDVVSTSASFVADGGVDGSGRMLLFGTAVSATTNHASVDNAALSSNGGVAHLHVPVNTRNGTVTMKIQHSTDNTTFADLVTFTVVGATTTTQERIVVAAGTTVNRYLRAQSTVAGTTGSITPIVAFSRR